MIKKEDSIYIKNNLTRYIISESQLKEGKEKILVTFLTGLVILIIGAFFYGKFLTLDFNKDLSYNLGMKKLVLLFGVIALSITGGFQL